MCGYVPGLKSAQSMESSIKCAKTILFETFFKNVKRWNSLAQSSPTCKLPYVPQVASEQALNSKVTINAIFISIQSSGS